MCALVTVVRMANPRAVSCQFCGGRYFRASLPFHFKACIARQEATRLACPYCKKQFRRGELQEHLDQCCKSVRNRRGGGSRAGGSLGEGKRVCGEETCERPIHPSSPHHDNTTLPQGWEGGEGEGDGRQACRVCGRKFSPHRIGVHETICSKVQHRATHRPPYDAAKHRLQGVMSSNVDAALVLRGARTRQGKGSSTCPPLPQSQWHTNWRRKHQEFVSMLRSAHLSVPSSSSWPSPSTAHFSSTSIDRSRWGSPCRLHPHAPPPYTYSYSYSKPFSSFNTNASSSSRPLTSALPSRAPPSSSSSSSKGVRGMRPAIGRQGLGVGLPSSTKTKTSGGNKRQGRIATRPHTANTT